jgi:hypothetical protein
MGAGALVTKAHHASTIPLSCLLANRKSQTVMKSCTSNFSLKKFNTHAAGRRRLLHNVVPACHERSMSTTSGPSTCDSGLMFNMKFHLQ